MRFPKNLKRAVKALVLVLAFALIPITVSANDNITVTIDGVPVVFDDQVPVAVGGRTLVPVRGVFEALGFDVSRDRNTPTITISNDDYVLELSLGSGLFTVNAEQSTLDVPAQNIGGRMMLPLRAPLEAVGFNVTSNRATNTVEITTMSEIFTTQIGRILGVGYTILDTEYVVNWGHGNNRFQFLILDEPLDVDRFPRDSMRSWAPTNTGDVFIRTHPNGYQFLYIDIGPDTRLTFRDYHNIDIQVDLSPTYTIEVDLELFLRRNTFMELGVSLYDYINTPGFDWEVFHRNERLSKFNMTRQYTSNNFYWYSTDERSRWISDMVAPLENSIDDILDALEVTLTRRMPILYYSFDDFIVAYPWLDWSEMGGGHGGNDGVSITRPRGSTTVDVSNVNVLLVHEFVHVIQFRYLIDWDAMRQLGLPSLMWVLEGTASYFDRTWLELNVYWIGRLYDNVRNNRIPTLDYLESDFLGEDSGMNYTWSATIFKFIHQEFGMEYVVEMNRRHGDFMGIFGFDQSEFERQWHQWLRANYR